MRTFEPLLVIFFRNIQDKDLIIKKVFETEEYEQYQIVLHRFESKTGRPYMLDELNLDDNTTNFVNAIMEDDDPNINFVNLLINDFSRILKTRSREIEKHVILIKDKRFLLLAHAKGGKGITKFKTDVNVRDRVLDIDNFSRYILFDYFKKDEPRIYFYEDIKTQAFAEYLGVAEGEQYFSKGQIYLYTTICGKECAFLYSEDELYGDLQSNILTLTNSGIKIGNHDSFPLTNIRWGSRIFPKLDNFKEGFFNKMENLNKYTIDYNTLRQNLNYNLNKYIDKNDGVLFIDADKLVVKKIHKSYFIVFCDEKIKLDDAFTNILVNRINDEELTKIFHVGHDYNAIPVKFLSFEVYNYIFSKDNEYIIGIVDILDKIILDVHSRTIKKLLNSLTLKIIRDYTELPFSSFINQLTNYYSTNYSILTDTDVNQEEIQSFDYKNESCISSSPKNTTERIISDIKTKIDTTSSLVICYGISDDKKIEGIPASRLSSDKISEIEKNVKLTLSTYAFIKVYKIKINEDRFLLLVVVQK